MSNLIKINNKELSIKEFQNQRVITFKDIDEVHERADGTASRNFRENRDRFIKDVDYFDITPQDFQPDEIRHFGINSPRGGIIITESGYLMLVKSLTDDLAWKVQRQLVDNYFRGKELVNDLSNLSPQLQLLINIELEQKEMKKEIQDMREVISLDTTSWRNDSKDLIVKIANSLGGNEYIREVRSESYKLLNTRMGVSLETRLTNKRRRMADEGMSKSQRDKLNNLDVIAEDKKLIEGYVAIIKEMAIKYGIA